MKPLILCLLSGACLFADSVTTNTQSRFFRAVKISTPPDTVADSTWKSGYPKYSEGNALAVDGILVLKSGEVVGTFDSWARYKLFDSPSNVKSTPVSEPPIPPVLDVTNGHSREIYFATNSPLTQVLFAVDQNASNVIAIKMPGYALETVTNWTDFVPSGFSTSTTLQDHNMGVEFGLIVTNRVVTFIEPDGYTTNIVIRSWTNQDAILNRTYRKTRTYDTNGVHVRNWTRVRVP